MSTPLFIRTPKAAGKASAVTSTLYTLFSAVSEPILVEEIRLTGVSSNTIASTLNVYLHDPDANSDIWVQQIEIPAPGPATFAYVREEDVGICIPVGWSLKVSHTLADGGGNVNADIIALGGVVR